MKKSILMIAFCGFILVGLSYEIMNDKHESISNDENIKQAQEQVAQKQVIEEVESQIKPSIADKNSDEFIDNKNGTVTFKNNGLMWQRCAVGQVWNGLTCDGDAEKFTWYSAMKLTSHFGGYDNWRLPTQIELMTLVLCVDGQYDTKKAKCINNAPVEKPNINTILFSNTQSLWFWTSSPYVYSNHYAWYVDFNQGHTNYNDKNAYMNVRLVR
jgi:hypothetical protein